MARPRKKPFEKKAPKAPAMGAFRSAKRRAEEAKRAAAEKKASKGKKKAAKAEPEPQTEPAEPSKPEEGKDK